MISVSTKMPYQEDREISLRPGKVRKSENQKQLPPCLHESNTEGYVKVSASIKSFLKHQVL